MLPGHFCKPCSNPVRTPMSYSLTSYGFPHGRASSGGLLFVCDGLSTGIPLANPAYWDKHLRRVLVTSLGFEAVDGHPSVFFQHETKLLVVVYVDDILASGPTHAQDQFWPALRKEVQLDDVE